MSENDGTALKISILSWKLRVIEKVARRVKCFTGFSAFGRKQSKSG
jgi:hypothetical protein